MAEPRALSSRQKPVNDLSRDERRKNLSPVERIKKPDQSDDRVEQIGVDRANVYRLYARVAFFSFDAGLHHDRSHKGRVEIKPETEIRSFFRRFFHLKDDRQLDRED